MSRFRKILLAFPCFCLVAGTAGTVVALRSLPPECAAERKYVHVSIDDCWQALARLSAPETKSVFDDPFFARLKTWHEAYGAKFTCYVFGETENFSLSDVPEKFKDEFAAASSWLKFGFHASSSGIEKTRAQSAEEFAENFAKTNAAIDAFAGTDARTTALRLDYFFAKDEWMPAIFAAGTRRLFGPDTPGRKAYALDAAASAELWARGELAFPHDQMGGGYARTDARFERICLPWWAMAKLRDRERIVVFTHEWAMGRRVRFVMDESFQWLREHGYEFTFFED